MGARHQLSALVIAMAVGARGESLADVLARMDKAAVEFRSFSADVKRTEYTAVLSESQTSDGAIRMRRTKGGVTGILEFGEPDPRRMRFDGRTAQTYYPKANRVEIIDIGKHGGAVEQFILLGFGTTAAEMRKSYEIKLGGTEQLGGVATTRIELTPKEAEARKLVTKIELWLPEGQGNPIQEKVSTPSHNYNLFVYSNLKPNPALPDSAFELNLPPNVKRITPNK
jgi:outer membrane lipoprotein-sorting protein